MTGPEMNAPQRKKTFGRLSTPLALGLSGLALAGCAGSFAPRTDPDSPLAPRVEALVAANQTYPRWADFPTATAPTPPAQIAGRVAGLNTTNSALATEVAGIEWTLADPDAFAAEVMRQVDSTPIDPTSAQTLADIEAFAESLRQMGKAPPPVDRR